MILQIFFDILKVSSRNIRMGTELKQQHLLNQSQSESDRDTWKVSLTRVDDASAVPIKSPRYSTVFCLLSSICILLVTKVTYHIKCLTEGGKEENEDISTFGKVLRFPF